jgi:hypothetical protein
MTPPPPPPQPTQLYEDGQDEVVVSVDAPCQLLGVGLAGTEGKFAAQLEVAEVDPADWATPVGGVGWGVHGAAQGWRERSAW